METPAGERHWPTNFEKAIGLTRETILTAWENRNQYHHRRLPKKKKKWLGPKEQKEKAKKRRPIDVPHPDLRRVQETLRKKILDIIPLHDAVHGFRKKRDRFSALKPHLNSKAFLKLDFRNAFGTARSEMLRRALLRCERWIERDWVETILGLTMFKGRLPQGTSTSNVLFNIACRELDQILAQAAKEYGWIYTRYADEVFFSSPNPMNKEDRTVTEALISRYGFRVAPEKTIFTARPHAHPHFMGLIIKDAKLSFSKREVIDRMRAFLHRAGRDQSITREVVDGLLGNIRKVYRDLPPRLRKPYRQFLQQRGLA